MKKVFLCMVSVGSFLFADGWEKRFYEELLPQEKMQKFYKEFQELEVKMTKEQALKELGQKYANKCETIDDISDCTVGMTAFKLALGNKDANTVNLYDKMMKISKASCDKDDNAKMCLFFGLSLEDYWDFHALGKEDEKAKSERLMAKYVEKSCKLGYELGCEAMMGIYAYTLGRQDAAVRLADDLCMNKNKVEYCDMLARFYSPKSKFGSNLGSNEYPNSEESVRYFKKAYELDKSYGWYLASALADDEQCVEGIKLMKSECESKRGDACETLGFYALDGKCVRYNPKKAKEYFGLACDYGVQSSCNKFKEMSVGF